MDDGRLKQSQKWDYFDEWLERIREIRASEKRFYQKIKDLYVTAIDYDKNSKRSEVFFKKMQNKMIRSVTGKTAAELIADRSDSKKPNMGLTSWVGSIVRKQDVSISKNYLKKEEIKELNHIVTMYLDYAELQAIPILFEFFRSLVIPAKAGISSKQKFSNTTSIKIGKLLQ